MTFHKATLLLFILSFFAVCSSQAQPTITTMTLYGLNPTNDQELTWRVTFSESVTGVSTDNFSLVPDGVTATLDSVASAPGGQSWYVTAINVSGNGTLSADLSNPSGISGASGPLVDTIEGPAFQVDNTAPQVVSIVRLDPSPTGASTVNFAVTFSEPVAGVSTINFASGGTMTGTIGNIATNDGITWTASISDLNGSGIIKLDLTDTSGIADLAGNSLFSDYTDGEAYEIDQTGPTVVCINRMDVTPTSSTVVRFLVEFDSQTSNVQTSSFSVTGTGTTTGTVTTVSADGDGTTWTVTVGDIEGQGTLSIELTDPTGIVDIYGNPMTATATTCQEFYNIDRVSPEVLTIDLPDDSPTSASSVTFVVTFTEEVTSGTFDDFSLIVAGTTTGTISTVTTSGSITTVTVSAISGSGSLCLQVDSPSTITDMTGNPLAGIPASSGCYVICEVLDQVTSSTPAMGETVYTTTSLITWDPPATDQTYHVYLDGALIDSTTDTQTSMPQPLTAGEHRYIVDIEGSCTSGTEVIFYVLDDPILVFPPDGFESCIAPTVFSWQALDGATTYSLYIDDTFVTATTATAVVTSSTSVGSHTWYVFAESEFTSRTSEEWNFTVLVEDPLAPLLYTTDGTIYDIQTVGATTYIAGNFSRVYDGTQWVPRNNIASFDAATSTVQNWAVDVNNTIYTLHATPSSLLIGGEFTRIAGDSVARIAALDYGTTEANSFRPGANGAVRTIQTIGNTVYYGGDFTRIGSQVYNFGTTSIEANRLAIATLDSSTTKSSLLNPNASVRDLLYDGSHLYVAGVFSSIGGQAIRGLARLDVSNPQGPVIDEEFLDTPDQLPVDLYVYSIHKIGPTLYIGGSFNQVLGEDRSNAAAIRVSTAGTSTTLLPWNPQPNSAVHSIDSLPTGGMISLGGTFTTLNNARYTYLVAVDPAFGAPVTCAFNGDRPIYAVEATRIGRTGEAIMAGGQATVTGLNVSEP